MTKLSEIQVNTVFFFQDDGTPMFLGNSRYTGNIHPKTVIKNLFDKNSTMQRVFEGFDDDDLCVFQVIRDTFGTAHYSKEVDSEHDGNVEIPAGVLRGTTDESDYEN